MERREIFQAVSYEEAMDLAVAKFKISSEKIFLSEVDTDNGVAYEALVDINLTLEGKRFIESYLNSLGVEFQLEARSVNNESEIYYHINSEQNSLLIGTKGRTLEALQLMVKEILRVYTNERIIVVLDIGDYREKRKFQLEVLATRIAKEVAKTKVEVKLDPMNPYDRRIVHNKLSEWRDVITKSEGMGENRAIVVKPKN